MNLEITNVLWFMTEEATTVQTNTYHIFKLKISGKISHSEIQVFLLKHEEGTGNKARLRKIRKGQGETKIRLA